MSTPQKSSIRPKSQRPTFVFAVGGALLVGVSLLSGAVLRGGGLVAAACVLAATTAALWLFVLFAQRATRATEADVRLAPGAPTSAAPPARVVREPREHTESYAGLKLGTTSSEGRLPADDRECGGRISGTTRRLRVLLIDDEELVLRSTARLLEIRGYSVLTARDYAEALAVAQREPELLLAVTDVVLSGISGKEVVRALRQLHPRLRVVYVSGYDVASSGIHLASDGSEEFLPKPFAPAVLDSRLRALLGLGDRADEVVSLGA